MGLDSVELVMEWEKYFGIQIPDPVAEKINTVQRAVDAIAGILQITNEEPVLRTLLFNMLREAILKTGLCDRELSPDELLSHVFPENKKETWDTLASRISLIIPLPPQRKSVKKKEIGYIISPFWDPKIYYDDFTFSDLTDVIAAANFEKLIISKSIQTKYEIYIALMAITVDKTGIDYYVFKPDQSFTSDFGID
jgi:hypothetical protein